MLSNLLQRVETISALRVGFKFILAVLFWIEPASKEVSHFVLVTSDCNLTEKRVAAGHKRPFPWPSIFTDIQEPIEIGIDVELLEVMATDHVVEAEDKHFSK